MTLTVDLAATFSADGADDFHIAAAFEVETGETVVVLGPSGSGKTLLLESVAGFHDHEGAVRHDERVISNDPPESRDFGFVFQDYALFPHMTVRENVGFGLRYHESERDPETLLSELGVAALAERSPPTLSGGERQRVALARSLAVDPEVLLLDEPLSSLDVPTRQTLRDDLQDVLADATAIYVTHDRTTARALADRIVVMNDGGVVQTGTPTDVFERPASPLVARFTGSNVLPLAALPSLRETVDGTTDDSGYVAIRPEAVVLAGGDAGAVDATATVERVTREDASTRVVCALVTGDGTDVTVDAYSDDPPGVGETVSIRFPRDALTVC
ncbi:ABC transporter ATP-binding protein [Halorientalis marina]|uniref:ABC transporter ATP-binding protein n=1 Tax=Halorientalis marina TaxID=2931976 RepID=UPI001FF48852|nr:ABC transporter ATP-binding protein [Halorientalis marina]